MKTLVRHIEVEFSLRYFNDESYIIDLFEDPNKPDKTLRVIGNGFLVGKFNQIITTQIIFYN